MGGTAPGEMPERDERAPCEFFRQFFLVRQVPAVFVTIKKGDIRAFLEEKNSRILPGDGGALVALQENTLLSRPRDSVVIQRREAALQLKRRIFPAMFSETRRLQLYGRDRKNRTAGLFLVWTQYCAAVAYFATEASAGYMAVYVFSAVEVVADIFVVFC